MPVSLCCAGRRLDGGEVVKSVVAVPEEQPGGRGKGIGSLEREARCTAKSQTGILKGWRGSEAGNDSKLLRKMKVEKGRKEWCGPYLQRGEEECQGVDTKATVKEEKPPSPH